MGQVSKCNTFHSDDPLFSRTMTGKHKLKRSLKYGDDFTRLSSFLPVLISIFVLVSIAVLCCPGIGALNGIIVGTATAPAVMFKESAVTYLSKVLSDTSDRQTLDPVNRKNIEWKLNTGINYKIFWRLTKQCPQNYKNLTPQ